MIRCSFTGAADCSECLACTCPMDDMSDEEYAAYKARLVELERDIDGAYDEDYYGRDEWDDER